MKIKGSWIVGFLVSVLLLTSCVPGADSDADMKALEQATESVVLTGVAISAVPTCDRLFGHDFTCGVTSIPNVATDCFTWFYDCEGEGCGWDSDWQPVGFVPITCEQWPCPTPNCGEGDGLAATCEPVPTCTSGETCYQNVPVIAVPILGWGLIGCNRTPTPGCEPYDPNNPGNPNACTPTPGCVPYDPNNPDVPNTCTSTPGCDPDAIDGDESCAPVGTPMPIMTIKPNVQATLTPTPYVFATHCPACVPTQVPDYDYIDQWQEFSVVRTSGIEKYIYFPVTVYHRVNEYEFIAIWGDAENYSHVVWVQLQKDGPQRTDEMVPGLRLFVYGQIVTQNACTDAVSEGTICFPAVTGAFVVSR